MDEYVGLPKDHPESYHSFMWNNFFKHIDIKYVWEHACRTHVIDVVPQRFVLKPQRSRASVDVLCA